MVLVCPKASLVVHMKVGNNDDRRRWRWARYFVVGKILFEWIIHLFTWSVTQIHTIYHGKIEIFAESILFCSFSLFPKDVICKWKRNKRKNVDWTAFFWFHSIPHFAIRALNLYRLYPSYYGIEYEMCAFCVCFDVDHCSHYTKDVI